MKNRIPGFDLARAYAIFGMLIVNLNMTFGDYKDPSPIGKFLSMFSGNSSTVFIILAGMGIALVSNRRALSADEKLDLKKVIIRKALFLFIAGMLLNLWWPADILHMYGCYMVIAAFILFVDSRVYLWLAALFLIGFHVFLTIIPYETAWNFETFTYTDFYTLEGFLRNTFYNGWNPIFPWMAYFLIGLYLGRFDWKSITIQKRYFLVGLLGYLSTVTLEIASLRLNFPEGWMHFIHASYLPPMLPFFISTASFSLILISGFMYIGERLKERKWVRYFSLTGQMTLTHYVSHVTIGILILSLITGKVFNENLVYEEPNTPLFILGYCVTYFFGCVVFSAFWSKYFHKGPLEIIMRKFSDIPAKKFLPGVYKKRQPGGSNIPRVDHEMVN